MVPHNSLFRGNLHHLFYSVQNLAERTHACNINSRRLLSKAAPPIDSTITPQADQRVQRKLSQSKPNVLLKPETTLYVYQVYNSDFKNYYIPGIRTGLFLVTRYIIVISKTRLRSFPQCHIARCGPLYSSQWVRNTLY